MTSLSFSGSAAVSSSPDISVSLCSVLHFSSFYCVFFLLLIASALFIVSASSELLTTSVGVTTPGLLSRPCGILPSAAPTAHISLDFRDQTPQIDNLVVSAHLYLPARIVGRCPTQARSSPDPMSPSAPVRAEQPSLVCPRLTPQQALCIGQLPSGRTQAARVSKV